MAESQAKPSITDAEVMAGVRSGDENAMAVLYDRYSRVVYSVALRVISDSTAAEDILQDIFMQLWRSPQAFDSARGNLGVWLAVITRHRAIDHLRKRRAEIDPAETVMAVDTDLEGSAARNEAVEKVRAAVSAMPSDQRLALEMAFFEGLTHTEIAERTGQPLGTVKTRIRSALLAVRKAVAK